jgi:hypothetical protein
MKRAEFEEREYETPLYNQLASGNPNVWAPGQVLEKHIGIDYALMLPDPWIFGVHGYGMSLPGVVLGRHRWLLRRTQRPLPTFRLNLFIQAKRSEWGRRVPSQIQPHGMTPPFWRFLIDPDQQKTLQTVASKLGSRALVVYAAPAFHELRALFLHTRKGTITSASTFPTVSSLSGHDAWYYNVPGATGVANPDVRRIEEPPLEDRIRTLLQADANTREESWQDNLRAMAAAIRDVLANEELAETPRRAEYFNLLREHTGDIDAPDEQATLSPFLAIVLFCELFLLQWYVLGRA